MLVEQDLESIPHNISISFSWIILFVWVLEIVTSRTRVATSISIVILRLAWKNQRFKISLYELQWTFIAHKLIIFVKRWRIQNNCYKDSFCSRAGWTEAGQKSFTSDQSWSQFLVSVVCWFIHIFHSINLVELVGIYFKKYEDYHGARSPNHL